MKTLNIFIENIYSAFEIDDVQILSNTKKIVEFFFGQKDLISKSCLQGYDFDTLCFDVVLCDNEKIQEINREYRQKDCPTDVISFAIFADSPVEERFIFDDEINIGEIIISLDKIKEQAVEHNNSFEAELYYLLSHGILHCLGFDHPTEVEYKYMVDFQEKAKAAINV